MVWSTKSFSLNPTMSCLSTIVLSFVEHVVSAAKELEDFFYLRRVSSFYYPEKIVAERIDCLPDQSSSPNEFIGALISRSLRMTLPRRVFVLGRPVEIRSSKLRSWTIVGC